MYLKKLSLLNFKNFDSKTFEFKEKINCFIGSNGVGKTNILDAIYYLSFAKSYFNPIAVQNIQHNKNFFVVEGNYQIDNRLEKIEIRAFGILIEDVLKVSNVQVQEEIELSSIKKKCLKSKLEERPDFKKLSQLLNQL